MGPLVLVAEDRDPDIVEERGAIDLVRRILDLELFHAGLDRAERGEVLAYRRRIEPAQPPLRRRVEMSPPGPGRRRRARQSGTPCSSA